jgi:hypothetical protein
MIGLLEKLWQNTFAPSKSKGYLGDVPNNSTRPSSANRRKQNRQWLSGYVLPGLGAEMPLFTISLSPKQGSRSPLPSPQGRATSLARN